MTLREPINQLSLDRRRLLTATATATTAVVAGTLGVSPARASAPGQLRRRLTLPSGVQTGDVTQRSGVLWSRSSGPGRLRAHLRSGAIERSLHGPWATAASDFTARIDLTGLAPGREYEAAI